MHDLKTNFDKILPIVKYSLADQLDAYGNLHAYPNQPDLPDTHIWQDLCIVNHLSMFE